ncbi:hypothetical protein DFH09DRAFT_1088411 [Mycena vulgaris]|nr:hypothetical protein DFH09DRAFT_1088411 [Mycena vulgaris]
MGSKVRWTPESKEYKDALVLTREQKYRAALAKLEHLVVQRLFELTKMGMSGVVACSDAWQLTNYVRRSRRLSGPEAMLIRRAIVMYNETAAALVPPRETSIFRGNHQTTSLAEFDLLRDTRQDIRSQPWTQPARREAMVLYYGIKRAKEEIQRLNVEICRLITSMVDEHVDYYRAIASTIIHDPPLATLLSERWQHTTRISTAICKRLTLTSQLVGFSWNLFPGEREGRDPSLNDAIPPPLWLARVLHVTQMVVEYEEFDTGAEPRGR